MKNTTITEAELQTEYERLDLMRNTIDRTRPLLTDEQFKIIEYARTEKNGKKVSWTEICKYFESRNWGNIPDTTLKHRFEIEKRRRGKV